jgi:uridine phosphorylase
VGASGAAFIFERLFKAGVRTVIRAGTCGAMVAGVPDGSIIIGTAAIREDGLSQNMVPMEFPAVADCEITRALQESARTLGSEPFWKGVVLTDGLYFPYPYVASKIDMWGELGAVAIEMEFATLLIQASIHKARAGGIFVSDGNIVEEPDPMAVDPDKEITSIGIQRMIEIALNALAGLE